MKKIVAASLSFLVVLLIVPMFFQSIYRVGTVEGGQVEPVVHAMAETPEEPEEITVTVLRTDLDEHQDIALEDYVVRVVAAEMPAQFEIEALKAQAVAVRTYALWQLEDRDYLYDTVTHQVFKDEEQLRERWGDDFDYYYARIKEAVYATKGLVMKHEGQFIEALFFAMSNGSTENSEDYFTATVPYLRSVNSEWDRNGRNFEVTREFTITELRNVFDDNSLTVNSFAILSRTEGGNVNEISVGGTVLTGRQFRSQLGLRSADFRIDARGDTLHITTLGNGHGVGLSQVGANEMAKMGKTFTDILNHYYQNIDIVEKTSLN